MSFPESNPYAPPQSERTGYGLRRERQHVEYAGFWRRFVAIFIDSLVLGAVGMAMGFVAGLIGAAGGDQALAAMTVIVQILSLVISVGYFAGMESSSSQATLGKMAMGIIVTDLDGNRISFMRGVGRWFAKILSGLTLLIGYIMAGFTERKQALHDMIAGTLVVKAA